MTKNLFKRNYFFDNLKASYFISILIQTSHNNLDLQMLEILYHYLQF